MIAFVLAFLLPALACDEPEEGCEEPQGISSHAMFDDSVVDARFETTALTRSSSYGLSGRLVGHRDAWVGAQGRWTGSGDWMGRASLGLDVFGSKLIDLRVGLYAGHAGAWNGPEYQYVAIGSEFGTGFEIGRFFLDYTMWGGRRPAGGVRAETDLSAGVRLFDDLLIYAHWLSLYPGDGVNRQQGAGLGIGYRF